ncbi:hypothetical protein OE88DRAFT_1735117 [Heliocybe sulcata]|uniref:Uncharacterized protein n=1 Tax=Heliocybe sulcata TaxID=5364 RepID=A0A5C3N1J6_9AGAM|nr:hypothetical protein OE88DRAFT_1735117 [Heliocybe sulcata]
MRESQGEYAPTQTCDDSDSTSPLAHKRPRRSAGQTSTILTAHQFGLGGALDSQTTDSQYLAALNRSPQPFAPSTPIKLEAVDSIAAPLTASAPFGSPSESTACAKCQELEKKVSKLTDELKVSEKALAEESQLAWYYRTMWHTEMARANALVSALEACGAEVPLEEQSQQEFLSPSPVRRRTIARASPIKKENMVLLPTSGGYQN